MTLCYLLCICSQLTQLHQCVRAELCQNCSTVITFTYYVCFLPLLITIKVTLYKILQLNWCFLLIPAAVNSLIRVRLLLLLLLATLLLLVCFQVLLVETLYQEHTVTSVRVAIGNTFFLCCYHEFFCLH